MQLHESKSITNNMTMMKILQCWERIDAKGFSRNLRQGKNEEKKGLSIQFMRLRHTQEH